MGKRSNFERVERDFYPTPRPAVIPLLPHLLPNSTFCEPCVGDGRLVNHLEEFGHKCVSSSDYEQDVRLITKNKTNDADLIITNPPWDRKILHPAILSCCFISPTWFLFDADWMHTKQSKKYIKYCEKIVSIGRIKWIEGSKNTGKDNCCWYLFNCHFAGETKFVGR